MESKRLSGKEILLCPDGSVYHLGLKAADLNQRIITVGSSERAELLAKEYLTDVKLIVSSRQFYTYSGNYKGVPVSIISIGMGAPNIDFLIREASYISDGKPLAVIRVGTCGIFEAHSKPGILLVADKSYYSYRNYAHWDGDALTNMKSNEPYLFAGPVQADEELVSLINKNLSLCNADHICGSNISAETFYSCQGRNIPDFEDENQSIVPTIKKLGIISCEMETHQLFHLSKCRTATTRSAAIAMGILNRVNDTINDHCTHEEVGKIMLTAGKAALEALIGIQL